MAFHSGGPGHLYIGAMYYIASIYKVQQGSIVCDLDKKTQQKQIITILAPGKYSLISRETLRECAKSACAY
jgi:hypothetical protein